jgi:hypothetical protein
MSNLGAKLPASRQRRKTVFTGSVPSSASHAGRDAVVVSLGVDTYNSSRFRNGSRILKPLPRRLPRRAPMPRAQRPDDPHRCASFAPRQLSMPAGAKVFARFFQKALLAFI